MSTQNTGRCVLLVVLFSTVIIRVLYDKFSNLSTLKYIWPVSFYSHCTFKYSRPKWPEALWDYNISKEHTYKIISEWFFIERSKASSFCEGVEKSFHRVRIVPSWTHENPVISKNVRFYVLFASTSSTHCLAA